MSTRKKTMKSIGKRGRHSKRRVRRVSPLCAAVRGHLEQEGVGSDAIRAYESSKEGPFAHIEGALVEGYADPDSGVLFVDLPMSMQSMGLSNRKHEQGETSAKAERRFRRMLADNGLIEEKNVGHLKRMSVEGKRRRQGIRFHRKNTR